MYTYTPRPNFDSPIEARFWEAWQRHPYAKHLPLEAQHQVTIRGKCYRIDFAHLPTHTAVELDGHDYHSSREQLTSDRKRERDLQLNGWHVFRFTGSEIHRDVNACVQQTYNFIRSHQPSIQITTPKTPTQPVRPTLLSRLVPPPPPSSLSPISAPPRLPSWPRDEEDCLPVPARTPFATLKNKLLGSTLGGTTMILVNLAMLLAASGLFGFLPIWHSGSSNPRMSPTPTIARATQPSVALAAPTPTRLSEPQVGVPTLYDCLGAAPAFLRSGYRARVLTDRINVRSEPRVPADYYENVVATLSRGDTFAILSGSRCTYSGLWWEVCTTDKQRGWLREEISGDYLVAPLGGS